MNRLDADSALPPGDIASLDSLALEVFPLAAGEITWSSAFRGWSELCDELTKSAEYYGGMDDYRHDLLARRNLGRILEAASGDDRLRRRAEEAVDRLDIRFTEVTQPIGTSLWLDAGWWFRRIPRNASSDLIEELQSLGYIP